MKRLNLSIDLEDNELFDKEVTDMIKAKVREIARNEKESIIQKEVNAEVKRLIESSEYLYRDKIKSIIKLVASETMAEVIRGMDIDTLTKEVVNSKINIRIDEYTKIVDQKCSEVLEKTINEQVKEKIAKIFSA